MDLKVEINKETAKTLMALFANIFNTGANMVIQVEFNSQLWYGADESIPPEVIVNLESATIKIE